jgi:predicted  nucleic acid-binding Zn-ribbon protein
MDANSETPRDLRKKMKRITESRDLQIAKNQEKSIQLKALRGTVDDLTVSRDGWKEKKIKLEEELVKIEVKLKDAEKELEQKNRQILELNEVIRNREDLLFEEKRAKEQDETLLLQQIEDLKKKYRALNS